MTDRATTQETIEAVWRLESTRLIAGLTRIVRDVGLAEDLAQEPSLDERAERYAATAGNEWIRPMLCDEALRLGRMLAALAPQESEVHGLCALMELQSSRLAARVAEDSSPILLLDQDRSKWDPVHIVRGLTALDRAEALRTELGPYAVQAAIAACHARADTAKATDWVRIA